MNPEPADYESGLNFYWEETSRRPAEVQRREREFPLLACCFASRQPAHFTRSEIESIMLWKHTDRRWRDRALRGVAMVSDERIVEATSRIEAAQSAEAGYRCLKGLAYGIGVASISAILAAARPAKFPVIDAFALIALVKFVPEPWHAMIRRDPKGRPKAHERLYSSFADACHRIAEWLRNRSNQVDWTPRRVDMALWGMGKQLAGPAGLISARAQCSDQRGVGLLLQRMHAEQEARL